MATVTEDDICRAKAKEKGEQTFTLVEHDKTAPRTICFWIMENIETAPPAKLRKALNDALTFRHHPARRYAD